MHSVLGNHKTMIHQYTVIVVIHVYNRIIVFTQQLCIILHARGVRGYAPPSKLKKWCNLVRFGEYFVKIL